MWPDRARTSNPWFAVRLTPDCARRPDSQSVYHSENTNIKLITMMKQRRAFKHCQPELQKTTGWTTAGQADTVSQSYRKQLVEPWRTKPTLSARATENNWLNHGGPSRHCQPGLQKTTGWTTADQADTVSQGYRKQLVEPRRTKPTLSARVTENNWLNHGGPSQHCQPELQKTTGWTTADQADTVSQGYRKQLVEPRRTKPTLPARATENNWLNHGGTSRRHSIRPQPIHESFMLRPSMGLS